MPFNRNQRSNDYIATDYTEPKKSEQTVQPIQKPAQQKTAYQQNVSQIIPQNEKWYSGDQPTFMETVGRIYQISQTDPERGKKLQSDFKARMSDPTSRYYQPYSTATNQAVKNLQSYGIDTNMLTDEWFANNTGWQDHLRFSTTTNGVLQPLKKSATDEDWIAYNLYQYQKSMGDTQKADTEWSALQQELTYKANRKDRNYSDDAIIDYIDWSKYPTLKRMKDSFGTPSAIELNKAINFSDETMRAVLWNARNGKEGGNLYNAIAHAAIGDGKQWQDNPELSAKLNWNNKDTYAPYSVGMTLDEEVGLYFNVDHFDQETLDQIRKTLDPNDETAMKMYNRASKAFSDTQKALKEKSWLDEKVNKSIKDGKSQEWILGKLDTWMKECPTLKAMDESIINGSNLVETTQAIDHKRADLEDSIRTRAAEKGTQHSAADVSEGTVKPGDVSAGTVYSWEDTENIEASPELKNLSSEVRDADEAKKEQRLRNQREADARAASKKDTTQDNITLQTKHSKDQEVRDVSSVMDDGASEMESAVFNSWSGSTEEAQAKLKEFKAGQINGEVVSDLDKIYQKQTDSVNKGYIEGSMNVWNSITGYQDQQKSLENAQNTLAELEKELGLKLYVGKTNDLSFETEIDGNKYRVQMSPDLSEIEAIDNINNPDVPTPVYAGYGLYDSPDEWDEDTRVWDTVENGKDISSFRDRYQEEAGKIEEASNIQLTDEDNAKLKAYRRAQMQIEDAEKYLEKNKEQYEKDLKEYQNLEQRRAVHIKNLKDAGVDTTSIEIADAVMNELTRYTSYEATQWDIYNPTYAYYKAIADGKDKNKVLADAEKEYAEISEQIKDLEWLQKYVSDHGIKLSADVKKNMDRRMEKMQRDMKDYEFFKVQWDKDFDKVAADAEAKEQAEIAAWQAANPNSTEVYANVGTIYNDFQDWYYELTDDEKKTWYYLKAQDEKNGTNKAKEYADFLTDETYGVMPVRGRENIEEAAEQITSAGVAGFVAGNALSVYLSPYNAIASTAYRIKNAITGEELNPNSGYLAAQQFRSKTREQSAQEILEAFGEKDEKGNYKETTLSKVAQAGYEILTNRLDSLANATAFGWMFGGIGNDMIKEFLSASPMGMSAAMETAAKAKDKGASDAQAYALATWTFFAETMTEAISLENIAEAREIGKAVKDGTYKQFLTNWLTKAGISEAFGESINDIIENLSDEKIMGVLSEHQALVDKYREDGLDPDQAELRAREDEINGVLRTALISYLSPGLDVFQVASGHLNYYRGETARRVAAGEEGLTVRQVRKEDIAKRREQRAKEKAQQEAWDQEFEQRTEGEMKPIDYDAAGDTYGLSTEDMRKEQLRLKKERADQFTLDFEVLETAEGGDASAQNAAVSAVLDEGSTQAETDEANAAATGLGDVVAEGKTTAAEVQDLMIGANVANGEIPFTTVKTGLKYAALGGEQSACRQLMQSQEYQNAAPALKAAMMAKAVQQDQQNDAVREAVQKNTHEYRVARAEGEIMAQNSEAITTKIESAEAASIEAEGVTLDAQRTLDSQKKVEQSAMQAAQRAAVYNDAATHERKLNEYRKQVEIRKSYERGLEAAQRKESATKKREERIKQQVRNDLRQQAEQMVAQEDQRRAEEAEQQRIEQEQQAAENAEAERTLNEQESNEEQQDQTSLEQDVRERLQEIGYSGEDLERQIQRVMGRADQNSRRKENMNTRLSEKDGDKFLRKISRRTGITYEMQDLGDPRKTRGKIIDRQHMILNSNLTKGQALVEAALHEVTHGVEETKAYENYASFVLNAMYKGEDTKEYNDALERKIKEYADDFNSLSPEEARKRARQELVAEYARLNLGKKEFVRGIVSNGLAGKFREVLSNAVAMLKGYTLDAEGKAKYQEMRKAMKLLNEAVNERAQQTKKSNNGHTGLVQMSINGWTDATGLTLEVTGDDSHMYRLKYNGEEIKPGEYKAEMVKGTPVGNLIDMAGRARVETLTNKLERGKLTQQEYNKQINKISKTAKQQREYVAQIINMIGQYQDAAMVWELAGSLAFSSLKTNGDPQYSDSYDFGTICTKTQAILNAISETQVKLGRALTKEEIDGVVYNEVGKGVQDKNGKWIHGATPCPPCYVYATWVNKPARLEKVRLYQQECVDWTNEQINEFMNRPDPEGRTKTEAKELKTEQNAQKLWISLCLADEVTDPETGKKTWVRKENPDICPNEILLDLRRSGDMAVQHPGTWTFMQKGGNAQGKAIAPYSDARLGESIVAKAIGAGEANAQMLEDERNAGNSEYIPQFLNPFLSADPNDQKQAEDYFKKAIQKIKAQNLKGGQRWQSWSDFRAEWGSDYLMEMITMEALGSQVQTYTKVVEALDLLASAGFEVNMSLMPHGDGFWHNEDGSIKVDEDGNLMLRFSNVTGINPEAAEAFARKYGEKGNVQPMVVGISDEHIKAALAGNYITFVIPFHGSGGSVQRLQHLMSLLHEQMESGNDYTKAQSDDFENYITVGEGKTKKKINTNPNWAIREKILTGEYENATDEEIDALEKLPFLKKLYEDRYLNEDSDAFGVFFSKGEAQQIYPYEYWDTKTTLATADKNSQRFIDYCQMLGVIPRFSGLTKTEGKGKKAHEVEYANFSGRKVVDGKVTYEPVKGYWKLLIDRSMYNRVYDENGKIIPEKCTYHKPQTVSTADINIGAMPQAANNTVGHSDDDTREITERIIQRIEMTSGQNAAAGSAVDLQQNADAINNAINEGSEQKSSLGDLSDVEIQQLSDELAKEQATYPSSKVELKVTQTPEQQDAIRDYLGSVNSDVLAAAKQYEQDPNAPFRRVKLKAVTDREAAEIKRVTGVEVNGYEHILRKQFFIHTETEHGKDGSADHSMSDLNDVARIGWVIENFDDIEWDGRLSWMDRDKNNNEMPQIRYVKRIDGTMYVVEAVGENAHKSLRVVTAHMEKINSANDSQSIAVTQVPDVQNEGSAPSFTSENAHASPANVILSQGNLGVNEESSTLGDLSESEMDQLLDGILKRRDKYSAPLEGENPILSSPTGPAQRQFGQGMLQESDEIDQQAKDYVLAHNGRGIDTNEEQLNRAIKWIRSLKQSANSDGFYEAMEQIDSDDFDYRSADGQARMIAVMGLAVAKGDAKSQARLADAFNRQGTDLGRALQARKLFRLMTPDGRKETLRNMLKKYQSELDAKGKRIDLKFSEWVYQAAAEATSEGDFEKVRQAALNELAEQIPANWKDRVRSLRMLAMLANPRTHIRNVIGNALFIPAVSIKNKLGAVAEIATGQKERTKTLAIASSKEIRDFARQDANNIKGLLTGEAKYSEATQIARAQNKLGRVLDWASEKNSNALEAEDWFFLKGHYRRALGGWMTANGYTVEQVQNDPSLLEKGREYAINEAQKATYRDFNKTAAVLNEVSRKGGVAGFLVDAALPFKKTPANILRRGIEYSPVGIVKTLTTDMYHLKQYQDYQNGKLNALPEKAMSPNQVIDHLCAGLSGTAVLALGFLLAGTGAVSCGMDDDEDKFGKEKGEQEYAIKLSLFGEDVTYTMDWAAPMSMPFFVGAAIRNQMESEGNTDVEGVLNAVGAMTEPVFNLSMLDGINTLFKTSSYDDTNPITQIGAKIASNYVSSYVPSVLGAISRTFFDDKQRKAFVESGKNKGIAGTFRYTLEQMQNKIPVLAQQNIAARDIWGNEKTTGFMERLFENFISPGYIEHVEEDPLINEMARVYEATGSNDAGLVPSDPDKTISFTRGGEQHKKILTDKEWDRFKEVRGQTAFNELNELFNNPDYQNATPSAQAQMIKNIWNHADKIGRAAVWSEYDPGEPKSVSGIAKEGKISTYKTEIVKALRAEDYEAYDTMVEAMREEYDDESDADSAIKEKIGNTFRDEWKSAYRNNDYATMYEIEEWLDYTGYDFNIYGKNGWQEKEDEKNGY